MSSLPLTTSAPEVSAPPEPSRSFGKQVVQRTLQGWGARVGLAWIFVVSFCAVFAPFIASSFPYAMKVDGQWTSPLLRNLTPPDLILVILTFFTLAIWPIRRLSFWQKAGAVLWMLTLLIPATSWRVFVEDWHLYRAALGLKLLWPLAGALGLVDLAVFLALAIYLGLGAPLWRFIVLLMVLITAVLIRYPIHPPETIDFSEYRQMTRDGKIEAAYYAPIPYSGNDRLRDFPELRLHKPTPDHIFGTEVNGADVLARIIHAARISSAIGFIATGIAVAIGIVVGGLMGYFVGKVDIIGMRLVEVFEAIPTLFLLISFVAFFGRNLYLIMAIIGFTTWTTDARFIRAEFLRLRNQDFVQAAIAAGLPLRSVLFRHMLPNGVAPVLVSASFGVASAILYESTLSFIGLGLVDEPSWGQMLNQAIGPGGTFSWWVAIFPGMAIFLTVFAYNLVGEALRDALDPKLVRKG